MTNQFTTSTSEEQPDRFILITKPTIAQLVETLNSFQEGFTRVIYMGQNNRTGWIAVLDRAIQMVVTPDQANELFNVNVIEPCDCGSPLCTTCNPVNDGFSDNSDYKHANST